VEFKNLLSIEIKAKSNEKKFEIPVTKLDFNVKQFSDFKKTDGGLSLLLSPSFPELLIGSFDDTQLS
jgi:hypothetical protein